MCEQPKRPCIVIGAGIVGLSTALCLQEKGYQVTILAERFGVDTTSHVAGGVFLPYNRNILGADRRSDTIKVVKDSWNHYDGLYQSSTQHTGIIKCFGYQCYFTNSYGEPLPDDPLVWEVINKFRSLSVEELKKLSPETPCSGWIIQTYVIQCQYYLPYLTRRFKSQGGILVQKKLRSFDELSKAIQFDVVINCSGLGAAELCGDEAMYPGQGQVAHMHSPHINHFFHCEEVYKKKPEDRQLIYVFPHTHHIYVGGTFTEHSDTTLVSEDIRRTFLQKLSHAFPSIQIIRATEQFDKVAKDIQRIDCKTWPSHFTGFSWSKINYLFSFNVRASTVTFALNSKIIKEECGVRPCRDTLRLETEEITLKDGRVLKVVHNYGHGGNGIALSWGTAKLASDMAVKITAHYSRL